MKQKQNKTKQNKKAKSHGQRDNGIIFIYTDHGNEPG